MNPLSHLRNHHMHLLTEKEIEQMSKNGKTSGSGVHPKRTLLKVLIRGTSVLPCSHPEVKNIDWQLRKCLCHHMLP